MLWCLISISLFVAIEGAVGAHEQHSKDAGKGQRPVGSNREDLDAKWGTDVRVWLDKSPPLTTA